MTTKIDIVPFGGWAHNARLSNGDAELLVTLDVGPRVLRYALAGGENVLGVMEGDLGAAGEPTFRMRGGHRLWTSPEDPARTYAPDNGPVAHRIVEGGVVAITPVDAATGLERSIEVVLAPRGAQTTLTHRIRNRGAAPVTLAPWALTVLAKGGTAIIPLPARGRHPGPDARTPADFAPSMSIVLWPYFTFADPRVTFGARYLRVGQDATLSATKVGLPIADGWAGYWREGTLFLKRFSYEAGARYPDGGCNFECYTDPDILELESLGPLTTLDPGAETVHVETWDLHAGLPVFPGGSLTEIEAALAGVPAGGGAV